MKTKNIKAKTKDVEKENKRMLSALKKGGFGALAKKLECETKTVNEIIKLIAENCVVVNQPQDLGMKILDAIRKHYGD